MPNEIKISVIVLTYNALKVTKKCLLLVDKALTFAQKQKINGEVWVIDNNSNEKVVEMVRKSFSRVHVIANTKNYGYAGGNNQAMKQAKGKYFLIINPDTYISEDTLVMASDFMDKKPECGVLGCRLTYEDRKLQPSMGYLPTPLRVFGWMTGLDKLPILGNLIDPIHDNRFSSYQYQKQVGWVTGAFWMLRAEVFKETGGFDENFFMYMEETEWCERIHKAGWQIWYTPNFSAVHLKYASSSYNPHLALTKELLGLFYFVKKHYPNQIGFVKMVVFLGCVSRIIAFGILGKINKVKAYWEVIKNI